MAEQNQTALEIFGLGQSAEPAPESGNETHSEPAAPEQTAEAKPTALATKPAQAEQNDESQANGQQQEQPKTEQKKPHVVPVSRLVQERKEYKGQIADKDRRIAELEQQIAAFRQPQQIQTPQVAQPPSIEEDPVNHFSHKTKTLEEQLAAQAKELEAFKIERQRQEQDYKFAHQVNTLEQSFVSQNPDYYDALAKVREIELNKLSLLPDEDIDALTEPFGVGYADRNAKQVVLLQQMEKQTAQQLIARGLNPVEYVYRLAGMYGYQGKPKPAAAPAQVAEFDETEEYQPPAKPTKKAPSDIGNAAKVSQDDEQNSGSDMMDMIQQQWYGKKPRR